MSTQSFPHMNELFSSLMDPDHSPKQSTAAKPPTPDISIGYSSNAGPSLRPLEGAHLGQQRQPRPVSEILKPESFVSPESKSFFFIYLFSKNF